MEKKQSRIFGFKMSDEMEKKVMSIRERTGIADNTNAIRYAISFTESKLNPAYITGDKESPKRATYKTPEDRVKAKEEKKLNDQNIKKALIDEKALDVCIALDGEIITSPLGSKSCKFKLYEKVGQRVLTGEREVPFDMLDKDHIESQYKGGTKEEIIKLLNK